MSIFGKSKREKQLETEVARLQSLLSPNAQDLINLENTVAILSQQRDTIIEYNKKISAELEQNNNNINKQKNIILENSKKIIDQNEIIDMQNYGIFNPTYKFATSDLYADRLKTVRTKQKELIKTDRACTGNMDWQVNGKTSLGKKMVKDMIKLLLRAYNLECDDIIRNVKISNVEKSKERIYKSAAQISKLGEIMKISITNNYIDLKIEELLLALEFEQKKEAEKERIREEKERQKEEAKVQKEIEEARKKLKKEQEHYKNALAAIDIQIANNPENKDLQDKKLEIEKHIADTEKAITDVDYREANKKAGYIYIISNIGAFGKNIFKIGMTRRLEPLDRIKELGDASVPFKFDVHALIFTDNAPSLEVALHNAFENKKLNKINTRKEFFNVTLDEIKQVIRNNFDKTVEWKDEAEAEEYRQSTLL